MITRDFNSKEILIQKLHKADQKYYLQRFHSYENIIIDKRFS